MESLDLEQAVVNVSYNASEIKITFFFYSNHNSYNLQVSIFRYSGVTYTQD